MTTFYRKLVASAFVVATSGSLVAQTSPIFINHGEITVAPNIDATIFYNDGVFDLLTDLPFSTINTRYFTNKGTMSGGPGFIFSYDADNAAGRQLADSIVNEGTIVSRDSSSLTTITDPGGGQILIPAFAGASWMQLFATNVFSSGLLSAGQEGLMEIRGKTVSLKRAGVRTGVPPNNAGFLFFDSDIVTQSRSNYLNPSGISDSWWGIGTNQVFSGAGAPLRLDSFPPQLDIPFPETPFHQVTTILGASNSFLSVALPFNFFSTEVYGAYVRTNSTDPTNAIIQVVFVAPGLNSSDIRANVSWDTDGSVDGLLPGLGGASVPIIEINARAFDRTLNAYTTNTVYIADDMAGQTNLFTAVNFNGNTGRPSNYRTAVGFPGNFTGLAGNNTVFNYFNHIYNFAWTSAVVTNQYTAYSFLLYDVPEPTLGIGIIGQVPTRGFLLGNPFVANWADPTNLPGRLTIESEGLLNLENTRIRGENYARLDSPHVEFNQNTIFDSPVLSLELGKTNNAVMHFTNTIPAAVERIGGPIYLWSANWTNQSITFQFDPGTGEFSSNVVQIRNFVTFVDNENLAGDELVTTFDFVVDADEIIVSDDLYVQNTLKIETGRLTLDSDINISSEVGHILNSTHFVGTTHVTNKGQVFQGSDFSRDFDYGSALELGPGYETAVEVFDNSGEWSATFLDILVTNLNNSGTLFAYEGPLIAEADTMDIQLGEVLANNDVYLTARTLDAGFSTVRAGIVSGNGNYFRGKLHLNITDSVVDGGVGANNPWEVYDGFEMLMKPVSGDFIGTRLHSFGQQFREVKHKWGAEDRGMDASGWVDNAVVGRLILDGQNLSLFTFETVNGNNAMYVETLEFRGAALGDPINSVYIEEGMTIYYNSSNLDPSDLGQIPNLVYYPMPTLPVSTEIVLANGQVFRTSNSLLESGLADSDADGIVNSDDENPFDDVLINVTVINDPEPQAVISWAGAPRTEYELQYKNDVEENGWNTLSRFTTMSDQRDMTVVDDDPNSGHRYYRVIYTP